MEGAPSANGVPSIERPTMSTLSTLSAGANVIAQNPSGRARRAAEVRGARRQERRDLLPAIAGLGAGGHAKCAVEAIRSVLRYRVVALLESDPALQGLTVLGCPVVGGDAMAALRGQGVELAFVGIGGAGDVSPRRAGAALLREAGFRLPAIVHRSASVAVSAVLEEGAQVTAGAVVIDDVEPGVRTGGVSARPLGSRRATR
jgi:hypothetical protein